MTDSPGRSSLEAPTGSASAPEDTIGRRIAAGLIDVLLLSMLFVALAFAIGDTTAGGGSFSISLSGAPFLVYLALVLLYYFTLEATTGWTIGKLLLGLRVVDLSGARPGGGAVALRTVLRLVDALPTLYLVGFIAMLATGARRQRLGDLAARTMVVKR